MKRLLSFLLTLVLMASVASAESVPTEAPASPSAATDASTDAATAAPDATANPLASDPMYADLMITVMSEFTEVYGYTQQEADAFVYNVSLLNDEWHVNAYPKGHPTWTYTFVYDYELMTTIEAETPFRNGGYVNYPGESAIHQGLNTAREKDWFTDWNAESAKALLQWMGEWSVHASNALLKDAAFETLDAAQAINEYFVSCCGEESGWTQALKEWRDAELAAYGLTLVEAQEDSFDWGIRTWRVPLENGGFDYAVTEFIGDIPLVIADALKHPKLEGWTILCGAIRTQENEAYRSDNGLAIFGKGDERLLVMLYRDDETTWQVAPIGEKALLRGQTPRVSFDANDFSFTLNYTLADNVRETFWVFPQSEQRIDVDDSVYLRKCILESYERVDDSTGERLRVDRRADTVTVYHADGTSSIETLQYAIAPYLDFLDMETLPMTAEECAEAKGEKLPEGYGMTAGVHLRAQTSSHSTDKGMYLGGVPVKILDEQPGNPSPWYHVRVGSQEGYMSSTYVDYEGSECSMSMLSGAFSVSAPMARTNKELSLKKGTGWFDATEAELPAGACMYVLAYVGDWLHVLIPQDGAFGWLMDAEGTDGYLKRSDVTIASTVLQLEWLNN